MRNDERSSGYREETAKGIMKKTEQRGRTNRKKPGNNVGGW